MTYVGLSIAPGIDPFRDEIGSQSYITRTVRIIDLGDTDLAVQLEVTYTGCVDTQPGLSLTLYHSLSEEAVQQKAMRFQVIKEVLPFFRAKVVIQCWKRGTIIVENCNLAVFEIPLHPLSGGAV